MFLPLACLLLTLGSLTFADAKSHHGNHHSYYASAHKTQTTQAPEGERDCGEHDMCCEPSTCCDDVECLLPQYLDLCTTCSASSLQARVVLMALCPMLSALLSGSMLF